MQKFIKMEEAAVATIINKFFASLHHIQNILQSRREHNACVEWITFSASNYNKVEMFMKSRD